MIRALSADELGRLIDSLLQPTVLAEAAAVALCLLLAWALVRVWRGKELPPGSIWFGERIVDGVLFPVLALVLALLARWLLRSVVPVALFHFVLPVLVSLVVIRLTVRVLHRAYPSSVCVGIVERSVSWIAWIAVALWLAGVLPLLLAELDAVHWKFGSTQISLRSLLEGLLSAAVVLVIALWVSAALEARLLAGDVGSLSLRKMAANALRALLLFVGLMFALSAAGIDLTALGVLGGALGVGIGFGLQKLAANYVSGFVILAERSMRIGDVVKIDGFEGRITDIATRYTVLRSGAGREAIVPNEMMITQRVENISLGDPSVQLVSKVQVAYGSDVETLMAQLATVVAKVPRVLAQPAPAVLLSEFTDNGIELTVSYWIGDPENGGGAVRSEVNLAVLRTIGEQGVEIAVPRRLLRRAQELPTRTPDKNS